jgi:hypothetical protein
MPLFARRTLQRILDENASFITRSRLSEVCNLLNTATDNYLAIEWEQVILNSASKFGVVQHEPKLGTSRIDMLFRLNRLPLEFIADITAPSDQGFDDLNPFDAFEQEVQRQARKGQWSSGGFHIRVDQLTPTIYKGLEDRVQLKLPKRNQWSEEIFNSRFFDFLEQVKEQPERKIQFDAVSSITGVHITYDPRRRGFTGGSHLSYRIATSKTRNPVYNALKNKGDQIKAARYDGMAGIFLCDGACEMISTSPSVSSFGIDEIIRYFFQQFDSVWFVAVFSVIESGTRLSVRPKLHLNPKKKGTNFSYLTQVVDDIHKSLPQLQWSPVNARLRAKAKDLAGRYCGILTSGRTHVEMSARQMLEILAGVVTAAEFEQNYSREPGANPFKQMLQSGRLITKISVEHFPEIDDDRVSIEFGDPDAAVAPFRIPPNQRSE